MAKQLFNSSEKSNFILNMTEDGYSKLASAGLLTACFSTSIATMIYLFAGKGSYMIPAVGTAVAGTLCMIIAIIGLMKKYISGKLVIPAAAGGIMLLLGFLSAAMSEYPGTGIYGFSGRGEGMLTISFYICFFIAAAGVKREGAMKALLAGIIGNGALNSVVSLIQIFKGKFGYFECVDYLGDERININAASGLSQSPLFLAMVLSISIAAALFAAVITPKKDERVICIIAAALFSFVNVFTYSLLGWCGTGLAVVTTIIMVIASGKSKALLAIVLAVIIPFGAGIMLVNAGKIGNISQYRLYDGRILWFADSCNRIYATGMYDKNNIDIDDTADVYYTLNRKTMDIISQNGLFGTGADQLTAPQLYVDVSEIFEEELTLEDAGMMNKGIFDRVYNEYLYTAATRGIPSLVMFIVILLSVLIIGIGNYRKQKNKLQLAMLLMAVMSMLLFFIGCTSTAFTPFFYMVAGLACVRIKAENK